VILCNPPYIPKADDQALQPEVQRYEPHMALTAGETGLEAYDLLSKKIRSVLKPLLGRAFFEVGEGQAETVAKLFSIQNFDTKIHNDLSGKQRCIEVKC
jgi:release factor glutamine methyltransferase